MLLANTSLTWSLLFNSILLPQYHCYSSQTGEVLLKVEFSIILYLFTQTRAQKPNLEVLLEGPSVPGGETEATSPSGI